MTTKTEPLAPIPPAPEPEPKARHQMPATTNAWPPWLILPAGMKLPGRPVYPVRFRAEWTDTPAKGDRQCILWSLSDEDEKTASSRALGDTSRLAMENCKLMVRAFDGRAFVQDGSLEGEFLVWWREIGQKCRTMLYTLFVQINRMSDEERDDFFGNCIARVIPGGG